MKVMASNDDDAAAADYDNKPSSFLPICLMYYYSFQIKWDSKQKKNIHQGRIINQAESM
jgi:hypothetical protein